MSLPSLHHLHRPLGSTGLRVSPLGLGTVKLGRDQGVKYPNGFTIPDDDQARLLLAQARELGINLIDTAPAYETEHIDLVLVHSDGNDLHILEHEEVYQTLEALKREGKIGGFGLSGKTVAGGLKALERGDCAMVTYNLNEQAERPVLDYAAEHGKAILVKKALASGHACLSPGVDPVRASFELLFAHPGVSSAIVGTINPVHLAHNVATVAAVLGS